MKTWFVNEHGACYSVYREGLSDIENMEFAVRTKLMIFGNLVALLTKKNVWLAERQEHLDNFIDQHIDWYMREHNLVSVSQKAFDVLDILDPSGWIKPPLDFHPGMTI